MRKVTNQVVSAFLNKVSKVVGNTSTNGTTLYLHSNAIAWHEKGKIVITNCGWFSNTTKERLNALPNVSIYQEKGVWYLNDKAWDGSPVSITI